jgi:hypothetical protein
MNSTTVIASKAKQSSRAFAKSAPSITAQLDCFASLAMTVINAAPWFIRQHPLTAQQERSTS